MAKQPAKEQIVIDDGIQLFKYPWTFQDLLAKNCMECYSNSRNNQGKIWSGRGLSSDMRGVELVEHMVFWWETVRNLLGEK